MKKLLLAFAVFGGLIAGAIYFRGGHCTDCHCKKDGWCCCSGVCKPQCDCPNCSCGK